MTNYKGFQIDRLNRIYKDGKQIFTARWQFCDTLEEAQTMIDSSLMAKELFNKFPNLSKIDLTGICELEAGAERDEQAERWMNDEAEKQLN